MKLKKWAKDSFVKIQGTIVPCSHGSRVDNAYSMHPGCEQLWIETYVLGHSLVRWLILSPHSLIRLLSLGESEFNQMTQNNLVLSHSGVSYAYSMVPMVMNDRFIGRKKGRRNFSLFGLER